MKMWIRTVLCGTLLVGINSLAERPPTKVLDAVVFGYAASEAQHQGEADLAPLIKGGVDESARMVQVEGGLTFKLKCDPVKPDLVTLRLWGGDRLPIELVDKSGNVLWSSRESISPANGWFWTS